MGINKKMNDIDEALGQPKNTNIIDDIKVLEMEIHNNVNAYIIGAKWQLAKLKNNNTFNTEIINNINECLDIAYKMARDISKGIRHELTTSIELIPKLEHLTDSRANKIPVILKNKLDNAEALDIHICNIVYKVTQEAVLNAQKHSEASRIEIALEENNGFLKLFISDDGIGFDINNVRSHGLDIMDKYAYSVNGKLTVVSEIGKGTKITLAI